MTGRYRPLLSLKIEHEYYSDRRCDDLTFHTLPETDQLLRNHRCIVKHRGDGIDILTQVKEDNSAFLRIAPGNKMRFLLRLDNARFPLFTDLREYGNKSKPVFKNESDSEILLLKSQVKYVTEKHVIIEPKRNDAYTLRGQPARELTSDDFVIEGLPESKPSSIDLRTKVFVVDTESMRINDHFEVKYATKPALEKNVFAHVEISVDESFPLILDKPGKFLIKFKAKKAKWLYYVLTDFQNGNNENQLSLKDSDLNSPLEFTEESIPENSVHETVTELKKRYPKLNLTGFRSGTAIPCSQTPKKTLQLLVDDEPVIAMLANPALSNFSPSTQVQTQSENQLFHVIKYLTNTF
ncbi:MAG: hypothetical protein DWQ05_15365 [Calditrichaeota bacterium]|nr:MAG: hypothetical protein DWQ05_15365 [Calditrichota bacterium]